MTEVFFNKFHRLFLVYLARLLLLKFTVAATELLD
jgi:hypothetical protein